MHKVSEKKNSIRFSGEDELHFFGIFWFGILETAHFPVSISTSIRSIIKIVVIHRLLLQVFSSFFFPLFIYAMDYLLRTHCSGKKTYFDCSSSS